MAEENNIITLSLLMGLLFITFSFVLYKRKALLMLRALFSTRYFQRLLHEGKLTNERIYFYPILLYIFAFPCLILVLFHFYIPEVLETYLPLKLYGITCGGIIAELLVSQFFLWFFTEIFNYQEQKHLYLTAKTLFRFYHAIFLICIIPIAWYAHIREMIFFVYTPFFVIILLAFFILFLRNINNTSRIHFFIYFCSLEILPWLLLIKLLFSNV